MQLFIAFKQIGSKLHFEVLNMQNNKINSLGPLIKVANNLIEKELNNNMRQLFTEFNLTGPQVALLTYLYEAQSRTVSQKELETVFVISHPTIRSIVKRLEQRQLINISTLKSDRRQTILSLSASGSTLIKNNIDKIYQVMNQINQKITQDITPDEQQQLITAIQKIVHNFTR